MGNIGNREMGGGGGGNSSSPLDINQA